MMNSLKYLQITGLSLALLLPMTAVAADPSVKVNRLHSFAHDVLNTYGTYSGRSPTAPPVMGPNGYLYGLDTWGGNALPWLQSVDHFTYKLRPVPGAYAARNSVVYDVDWNSFTAPQGATGALTLRNGVFYGTLTGNQRIQNKIPCDWTVNAISGIFRLQQDFDPSERLPLIRDMLTLPAGFQIAQVPMPADFVDRTMTKICQEPGELRYRFQFVPTGALALDETEQMLYGVDDGPVKRVFRIDLDDQVSEFWVLPQTHEGRRTRPASIQAHAGKLYLLVHLEALADDETSTDAPSGLLYQLDPQHPDNPVLLHRFTWDEGRILLVQSEHNRYWRHITAGTSFPGDVRMVLHETIDASYPDDPIWETLPSSAYLHSGGDGWLYGNARDGGDGFGTLWRIRPDGSDFMVLYRFSGPDGDGPIGPLALMDGYLYGTTQFGGAYRCAPADYVPPSGPGAYLSLSEFHCTNEPYGSVGDAKQGYGTLFRINTGDTGGVVEPLLHSFNHAGGGPDQATNADGSWPVGVTAGQDGRLYGATRFGGYYLSYFATSGDLALRNATNGTLFQVDLDALAPTGVMRLEVAPADGVLMLGESATLSWQGTNVSNCQAEGGLAGQPWRKALDVAGSDVVTPHFPGLGNYLVYCDDDLRPGGLVSASIELRIVGPTDVVVRDDRFDKSGSALQIPLFLLLLTFLYLGRRLRPGHH